MFYVCEVMSGPCQANMDALICFVANQTPVEVAQIDRTNRLSSCNSCRGADAHIKRDVGDKIWHQWTRTRKKDYGAKTYKALGHAKTQFFFLCIKNVLSDLITFLITTIEIQILFFLACSPWKPELGAAPQAAAERRNSLLPPLTPLHNQDSECSLSVIWRVI